MNKINLQIPTELYTNFNEVTYYDEPHQYFINDEKYVSVTTLIHEYQEEFDEDYWSQFKANQFGLTQKEIIRAWNFINRKGTMKGSLIHDYSENVLKNKVFKYPKDEIIQEFGFDPITVEYDKTKILVDKFREDTKGVLIPISVEQVVYDKQTKISGMFDILFWNVLDQEFQIWDNKTNKVFTMESERYMLGDLSLLQESDLEIYSLQLEMYKQIIERNTSIKLGKSYVVWYYHNNPDYQIIPMKNRKFYIDKIFENRLKTLAA